MTPLQLTVKEEYRCAFLSYLQHADESALRRSYEFGRRTLAQGIGEIEIIAVHHEIIADILGKSKSAKESKRLVRLALAFLLETISPFEMSVRGYRETVRTLQRSAQRHRHIIEAARDLIYTLAANGTIKSLNPIFESLSGWKTTDWEGKPFQQIVHPEDGPLVHNIHQRVMNGEKPEMFELRICLSSGGYIVGEFTTAPEYEDGIVIGALGIARDITERKNVQNQLRALAKRVLDAHEEERRRLSRELHDDLCQWLSGTKMTVGLLEEHFSDDKHAQNKLRELKEQINDRILEVRRMAVTLRPSALDDFGMATALGRLCEDYKKIYDIEVSFVKTDLRRERYVPEVEVAMYRITQEALSNIVRHARAGHAKVCIRESHDDLVVEISDDGVGFELNSPRYDQPVDTGIGMVSMRERANLLQGHFNVESAPGKGTTVRAEIPFAVAVTR